MPLGASEITALARATRSPDLATAISNALAGGDPAVTANTAITTVGAGTLTAAAIVGGVITRSGSTAAYTDTTATAAGIYSALGVTGIGQSWLLTIKNTVAFAETLAGGTGVTLSGLIVVPPLSTGTFLVTLSSATAATVVGLGTAPLANLPPAKFTTTAATGTTTAVAGDITGAAFVNLTTTGAGAIAYTTRTAAQMFADIPNAQIGMSYMLRIRSSGGSTVTLTAAGGGTVTLTGTMTIADTTARLFCVTVVSATAITIQDLGVN